MAAYASLLKKKKAKTDYEAQILLRNKLKSLEEADYEQSKNRLDVLFITLLICLVILLALLSATLFSLVSISINENKSSPPRNRSEWILLASTYHSAHHAAAANTVDPLLLNRQHFIRNMTLSAWSAYKKYAWGASYLTPLSNSSSTGSSYPGQTIFTAMSTLLVMKAPEEFEHAQNWISQHRLNLIATNSTTLINSATFTDYIGGLLSAYALTGSTVLLKRAQELASTLSGLSNETIYFPNVPTIEYTYLWAVTGDGKFKRQAEALRQNLLEKVQNNSVVILLEQTFSALLKLAIQTDDGEALDVYMAGHSSVATKQQLVHYPFFSDNCQLGGMLALGSAAVAYEKAATDSKNSQIGSEDEQMAEKITEQCYQMANRMATKLVPFNLRTSTRKPSFSEATYSLSPELAESYFLLWRTTHNIKYRDYAWQMVEAIEKHCRTASGGYATIQNVTLIPAPQEDYQPAALFTTLKYLYLIFTGDDVLPLDRWVFNSAGHPLPICGQHRTFSEQYCRD